jgi:hypothetical protein
VLFLLLSLEPWHFDDAFWCCVGNVFVECHFERALGAVYPSW